jgi:hypothetical protein
VKFLKVVKIQIVAFSAIKSSNQQVGAKGFREHPTSIGSRDSAVGIATGYGLED